MKLTVPQVAALTIIHGLAEINRAIANTAGAITLLELATKDSGILRLHLSKALLQSTDFMVNIKWDVLEVFDYRERNKVGSNIVYKNGSLQSTIIRYEIPASEWISQATSGEQGLVDWVFNRLSPKIIATTPSVSTNTGSGNNTGSGSNFDYADSNNNNTDNGGTSNTTYAWAGGLLLLALAVAVSSYSPKTK